MKYIVAVWMVGAVVLALRAQCLRNKLFGYLRTYYPDIARKAFWHPWFLYRYPWFFYNRVLATHCREHNVEDPELDDLRQAVTRAMSTMVLWFFSLPLLFVLFLAVVYLFSR